MVLHFLTSASPPSTKFLHPGFCQKRMIKCTCSDLYSSIVPLQHFHSTPSSAPNPYPCALYPYLHFSVTMHLSHNGSGKHFAFSLQDTLISRLCRCLIWHLDSRATQWVHSFAPKSSFWVIDPLSETVWYIYGQAEQPQHLSCHYIKHSFICHTHPQKNPLIGSIWAQG